MRVLCAFTGLHPATAAALALYAPDAGLVDVSGSKFDYWHAIRDRWDGTQDLVIIEQDIEIHAEVLPSFAACPEPWCTFSYPIFRTSVDLTIGLGCVRFSAGVQRMVSAEKIAEGFVLCATCKGGGCWWHLDSRIAELLKYKAGLRQHVHGTVTHHHDYSDFTDGEPVAAHGRPIEWFFGEDADVTPAVKLADSWACRELIAVHPRQALLIAGDLAALAEDRRGKAVPARQSRFMRWYWEGQDAAVEAAMGGGWRPGINCAADERQALAMAADLALLAGEHGVTL